MGPRSWCANNLRLHLPVHRRHAETEVLLVFVRCQVLSQPNRDFEAHTTYITIEPGHLYVMHTAHVRPQVGVLLPTVRTYGALKWTVRGVVSDHVALEV